MFIKKGHLIPALIIAVDVGIIQPLYLFLRHTVYKHCREKCDQTDYHNKDCCDDGGNDPFFLHDIASFLFTRLSQKHIHDIFYVLKWMFKIVCITIISYCARFTATYVSFR